MLVTHDSGCWHGFVSDSCACQTASFFRMLLQAAAEPNFYTVQEIFKVMCEVAAQNPDPGDNGAPRSHLPAFMMSHAYCTCGTYDGCAQLSVLCADSEGEEDMYCNQEEILAGSGGDARAAMLDHFDSMLQIQPGAQINEVAPVSAPLCLCMFNVPSAAMSCAYMLQTQHQPMRSTAAAACFINLKCIKPL